MSPQRAALSIGANQVARRLVRPARLTAAALLCSSSLLACESGGSESDAPASSAAPAFAVESITIGLGFDEPVAIDGSTGSAPLVDTTELELAPGTDGSAFQRSLKATDGSGNVSSLSIRVEVRDGV